MTIRRARSIGVLGTVVACSAATMVWFAAGASAADAHPAHPVHPVHPARPAAANSHEPLLTLDLTGLTGLVTDTTDSLLGPRGVLGGTGLLGTTPTTTQPRPVQHTQPPAPASQPASVPRVPVSRHAQPADQGVVVARARAVVTQESSAETRTAPTSSAAPRPVAIPAAHVQRRASHVDSPWVPLGMGWLPAHASLLLVFMLVVFSALVALVVRAGSHRGGRRRR